MKINSSKIQNLMNRKLMTQGTLAIAAGVSRVTVNNTLLKGSCSAQTAGKLAEALGVAPEDIVETE